MRETFRIGISDDEFAGALASELSTPGGDASPRRIGFVLWENFVGDKEG
jgi:hypothetical protein